MAANNPQSSESLNQPKRRTCGTMPVHERLLRTNPQYALARAASENAHFHYLLRGPSTARQGVTVIPVVVHVVYNAVAQNIGAPQIQSQIEVLNRDFRKANADLANIPPAFQPLAADARIEFALATKDPNGVATDGVTHTHTNVVGFTDDDNVKSAGTGGADAWPADKYLNIWVCQLAGGLLGYAQFPGGPAATDGVVILHSAFGTNGTAAAPFNLGRSATHEIGHWLNLRHIWGDDGNGCNGSDFVDDTPNQAGANYGTPAFPHVTCNNGPNGDLYMDYMDYVDDDAMFMFTAGQVDRMQACLDSDRASIGTQKPGPTLKFSDDQHPPTIKFADDHHPPTIKFRDDLPPTLKFREDQQPSIKFTEDHPPTIKFTDDSPPTAKFYEDVKMPALDKIPAQDVSKPPGVDGPVIPGGGLPHRASPFILSTPHHSMAWVYSFPSEAQSAAEAYLRQIIHYEDLLQQYAQADEAGRLSAEERSQADSLNAEYHALVTEYRQLVGG